MKKNIVIYTAIFGKRDILLEPKFIPEGVDFVCFTDQSFKSKIWQIRRVEAPLPEDFTRSNRYFKILPHRILSEYDMSIYIDGNVIVTSDVTELIRNYLKDANFAAFDCALYTYLPIRSVSEQTRQLTKPVQYKERKESFENIRNQATVYAKEGFPDDNGHIMGMLLVRRHNERDVIEAMDAWWHEVMTRSKRDLMSFNYVAWKLNFSFNYIPLDGGNNQYVEKVRHYQPWYIKVHSRVRALLIRIKRGIIRIVSRI